LPFVENIVKFLKSHAKAKFSEFVCDFIKDESGIWWVINIKAFVLDREVYLENIKRLTNWDDEDPDMVKGEKPVDYQNTGKCGYCEETFDREDLNKKLTYKMIIQMDRHFYHRGKDYDWLDRSEFKYLDLSNLYLTHYVCKICYKLYQEMKELVDTYEEFSKYIGVQMALDKSGELVSITSLKKPPQELLDANKAGVKMGDNQDKVQDCEHGHGGGSRPPQTQESMRDEVPPALFDNSPKSIKTGAELYALNRFRMIILLHSVENIPSDIDVANKNYFIDFTVFGTNIRYALRLVDNAVWGNDPNANFEHRISLLNRSNSGIGSPQMPKSTTMGPGHYAASRKGTGEGSSDTFGPGPKNRYQSAINLSEVPNGKSGSLEVIINRLKCFYFFSEERLGLTKWIDKQKVSFLKVKKRI
jgi:hypothetical protein